MAPVIPFLDDTEHPFKQVLATEQTSQSIQARIHEKRDAIQAVKKRAVDQGIPRKLVYVDIKRLEKEISEYKRRLDSNERSRRFWRALHLAHWRLTVRPLKVVHLPHEILTMIFAHFEDDPTPPIQVESNSSDDCLPKPDVANIRNIRLTCRSFCEAGSRFLLPVIEISFTRSSVQRLEEISNHPTISRGVRIIRIHADAYSSWLANNWGNFCNQIIIRLETLSSRFELEAERVWRRVTEDCRLVGLIPEPRFLKIRGQEMVLQDAEDLAAIVKKFEDRDSSVELALDPFETKISEALVQTHQEYKGRYREQQSLAEDAQICTNISTAISLMPFVQRLCIVGSCGPLMDEILGGRFDEPLDTHKWRAAFRSPNPFQNMMLHQFTGVRTRTLLEWNGIPAFSLVLRLPLVLQAGSRNLTHLDIDFPAVSGSSQEIAAEHLQDLRLACQQLKVVQIRVTQGALDRLFSPEWGLAATYSVIEAMLVSPDLEAFKLDLQTEDFPEDLVESDESVASLLAGISWDKLRTLHLANVSIEVDELRELLARAPGKIHLNLTGVLLLEGTWAEALEILRGRADSSSRVVNPRGKEIAALSRREADYFRHEFDSEHRNGWYSAQRCPGPASHYIRGGDISNPLIRVYG